MPAVRRAVTIAAVVLLVTACGGTGQTATSTPTTYACASGDCPPSASPLPPASTTCGVAFQGQVNLLGSQGSFVLVAARGSGAPDICAAAINYGRPSGYDPSTWDTHSNLTGLRYREACSDVLTGGAQSVMGSGTAYEVLTVDSGVPVDTQFCQVIARDYGSSGTATHDPMGLLAALNG
jgi:hypothetical protein